MSKSNLGALAAAAAFLSNEAHDAIKNISTDARQAWRAIEAIERLRELGVPLEDEGLIESQAREHLSRFGSTPAAA